MPSTIETLPIHYRAIAAHCQSLASTRRNACTKRKVCCLAQASYACETNPARNRKRSGSNADGCAYGKRRRAFLIRFGKAEHLGRIVGIEENRASRYLAHRNGAGCIEVGC